MHYIESLRTDYIKSMEILHGRSSLSSTATRKSKVREILIDRDFKALSRWATRDRAPLRILTMLLFDDDPLVHWRAVEGIGKTALQEALDNPEKVRKQIRNYLWMMNDESGALCHRAPEAIGEILANVPEFLPEFGRILPNFLWEEPFERGTRWAMYRLVTTQLESMEMYERCIGDLLKSLENEDDIIRGYSMLILGALDDDEVGPDIEFPEFKPAKVPYYDYHSGELKEVTVA